MDRLVALVLVGMLLLPSVPAAADVPHLLVRIHNEGEATTLELAVAYRDEAPYFVRHLQLAKDERVEIRVDGDPGTHRVTGDLPDPTVPYPRFPPSLDERGPELGAGADNTGCPGGYAVELAFAIHGFSGSDTIGCTVRTPEFEALLAEARAAKIGVFPGSVDVPMPGERDRGVYERGGEAMPFEWRGDVTSLDARGEPVRGPEVAYLDLGGNGMGFGDIFGGMSWAFTENTMELLRYREGETRPVSWSRTIPADPGAPRAVQIAREIRYDEARGSVPCLLRNGLQGTTVRAGDVVPADAVCPVWRGSDWTAKAPFDWQGLRVLPLYRLEETPERTHVSRVLLADGIPYPVAYESHTLATHDGVDTRRVTLERLERRGEPLVHGTSPPEPSAPPALAPLDPIRGPRLSDGSRFALPLAEAVDAARADPVLRLRTGIAGANVFLGGAAYAVEQDPGSPARRVAWLLAFVDVERVWWIGCERLDAGGPVPPPVRCERPTTLPMDAGWQRYEFGSPLFWSEPLPKDALPTSSASFDDALARWDASRADGPADEVTFALYRTWPRFEEPPIVAVGLAPPRPMTPAASGGGAGDYAALRLDDGGTFAVVELTQEAATFDPTTLALVRNPQMRAADGSALFDADLPLLAGGGIAIAILLALIGLLLYSRLARARVLDDATRARIHAAVAAEPGLHASAILDRVGRRGGVGDYHLDVLVREGYLTCVVTPGFRRYYVTGRHTPAEMRAMAALREGQNEKLMAIIRQNPGIELRRLAAEAGLSVPQASRSVARLAEAGLIEKVQVGRAIALHAVEA